MDGLPPPVAGAAPNGAVLSATDAAPGLAQHPALPSLPAPLPPPPVEVAPEPEPSSSAPVAPPPAPPRKLIPTRWLRFGVIAASLAGWGAAFFGSPLVVPVGAFALVCLLAWSGLAVENVRRARVATTHNTPPHPLAAVLWWFAGPIVAVAGAFAVQWVARWEDEASYEEQGTRSMLLLGAVVVALAFVFAASYRPYSVLRKASRWVSGDNSKMRNWFFAPFIAAIVAVVLQVLAALSVLADSVDGASGASTTAAGVVVLAVGLPILAWLICGSRAMTDLEEATRHQHDGAKRDADPTGSRLGPLNPIVTGQIPATRMADRATPAT